MIYRRNETHDPGARSWVESANQPETDFPIQNLPFGVFRGGADQPRVGVAIGDQVLDIAAAESEGLFAGEASVAASECGTGSLNSLMAMGHKHWSALRKRIFELLRHDAPAAVRHKLQLQPMAATEMQMPAQVGDYTDFYASKFHATNVGTMFRPDNPLFPNYKWMPIAYHGRASSLVISGTPVYRPKGQINHDAKQPPLFGPSKRLDYELEVAFFVGPGNGLGEPLPIRYADRHIFGLCLLNDWSARDVQGWEYQPLGPFLAKNFATTISPWVVTLEALAPFRVEAFRRAEGDPQPLPYLFDEDDQRYGGIRLAVEAWLSSEKMRAARVGPMRLSRGSFADMYWTIGQMLAHHASGGCNLRPGDLIASGTVSGPAKDARGCLLELTWRGTEPFALPTGEQRRFLEDGDEITLRAYAEAKDARRIGFGECIGRVLAAKDAAAPQ